MAARIFLNYLAKGTWQADGFSGRFSLSVVFLCVLDVFGVFGVVCMGFLDD